jgi:multidrug efflux pump subunit AcrB
MALSLCIGLLIDDAIVVRENIVRHLGMGKNHRKAAEDGTNEIGLAVMATTFAIVAVFIPVAFMEGIIGRFFLQFGITVAVAVLVSLFVSFTLDPMLSSVWPDPVKDRFKYLPWLGRFMHWLEGGIEWLHGVRQGAGAGAALAKLDAGLAFALFAGSLMLVPMIGGEMMPEQDNGWVNLRLKTPVGSSLEYTDNKVRQVEAALKEFPEIDSVIAVVGTWDGRNTAQIDIKLKDRKTTSAARSRNWRRDPRAPEPIAGITLSVGRSPSSSPSWAPMKASSMTWRTA